VHWLVTSVPVEAGELVLGADGHDSQLRGGQVWPNSKREKAYEGKFEE